MPLNIYCSIKIADNASGNVYCSAKIVLEERAQEIFAISIVPVNAVFPMASALDRQTRSGSESAYSSLLTVMQSLTLQPAETLHFWNRSGFELLLAKDFLPRFLEVVSDWECLIRDVIFRICYMPALGWDPEAEVEHQGAAAWSSAHRLFFQTALHWGK